MSDHFGEWMLHNIVDPDEHNRAELIQFYHQLIRVVRDQHAELSQLRQEKRLRDVALSHRSGALKKLGLFQYSRRTLFRMAMLRYWNFPQKGDMREMGTLHSDGENIHKSTETFIAPFPYSHKEIAEGNDKITAPTIPYKSKLRECIKELIKEALDRKLTEKEEDWIEELTNESSLKKMVKEFL
jgi:hypothetical protein